MAHLKTLSFVLLYLFLSDAEYLSVFFASLTGLNPTQLSTNFHGQASIFFIQPIGYTAQTRTDSTTNSPLQTLQVG